MSFTQIYRERTVDYINVQLEPILIQGKLNPKYIASVALKKLEIVLNIEVSFDNRFQFFKVGCDATYGKNIYRLNII